jgi:hypothetical protein
MATDIAASFVDDTRSTGTLLLRPCSRFYGLEVLVLALPVAFMVIKQGGSRQMENCVMAVFLPWQP